MQWQSPRRFPRITSVMSLLHKMLDKLRPPATPEKFTLLVMRAMRKAGATEQIHDDPAAFCLRLKGSANHTVYLHNGYAEYRRASRGQRAQVIHRFASFFRESGQRPTD